MPGLLVLLYCCGRLKLSDDHALRLLLYCGGRLKLSDGRVLLCGFPPKGSNCSFLKLRVIRSSHPHAKKYSSASRENQILKFPGFLEGLGTRPSEVAGLRDGPLGMPGVAWL